MRKETTMLHPLLSGVLLALSLTMAAAQQNFETAAQIASMYNAAERVYSYNALPQNSPAVVTTPYGSLKVGFTPALDKDTYFPISFKGIT
jgi:hypothetical protein